MTTHERTFAVILTLGSAALLIGAWGFQYFGIAPCKMCYWQRYPHMVAVLTGPVFILSGQKLLAWLGAGATLTTAAIGFYHSGVEIGVWEGPSSCTSTGVTGLSSEDLFNHIMEAPLVRCDEIAWDLFGLTMANYNTIFSLCLALGWILIALRRA